MKKLLPAFLLFPFALTAQDKFVVSGNVQGLPEGSAVSISDINNPTDTLAKSTVKSGVFELNGSVSEPNLLQLNLDGIQKKSVLFIGNENVKLSGNTDALQDLAVSGSAVHDDFEIFKKTFNPLFEQLSLMGQRIQSGGMGNDSLMKAYNGHLEKVKTEVDGFVKKHPSSPVSPFMLLVTSELEQDKSMLEKRYAALDKKVQSGFYGNIIKQQIDNGKAGGIGSKAVEFSQADAEGKQVALS